jgi:hypothetical protein
MYSCSNKKNVNQQFAKQERHRTLLSRQHEVDQWADVDLQGIKASPILHHYMARQGRKDNVFSLPLYLSHHVHNPAIEVSDECVQPPYTYMFSSRISCQV